MSDEQLKPNNGADVFVRWFRVESFSEAMKNNASDYKESQFVGRGPGGPGCIRRDH